MIPKVPIPDPETEAPVAPGVTSLASRAEYRILIVDAHFQSSRSAEATLSTKRDVEVEVTPDLSNGWRVLRNQVVDLLILNPEACGEDGFEFLAGLRNETRFQHIPVVAMSPAPTVTSKIRAFELGVFDYLDSDIDPAELQARVDAILDRQNALRRSRANRHHEFVGDFDGLEFSDLVHLIALSARTGRLSVLTGRGLGQVDFLQGEVVHALFENLEGAEAFYHIMSESRGQFAFAVRPAEASAGRRTIHEGSIGLLMEGTRRIDERRRGGQSEPVEIIPKGRRVASFKGEPRQGLDPTPEVARELATRVTDPFLMGRIEVVEEHLLADWTARDGHEHRLHFVLFTGRYEGASIMTSLAAPLRAEGITAALAPSFQTVALSFRLGREHALDITLLEQDVVSAPRVLGQRPAALIIAPRYADWMDVSVEARHVLRQVCETNKPRLIVGVGDRSLEHAAEDMPALADTPKLFLEGDASDARTDFRWVFGQILRTWAQKP